MITRKNVHEINGFCCIPEISELLKSSLLRNTPTPLITLSKIGLWNASNELVCRFFALSVEWIGFRIIYFL